MVDSSPVRFFLVDDHPVVRMGLRHVFEQIDHFSVVGEAGSGEDALAQISKLTPDLALVDVTLEGMDGIELTRHLGSQCPEVRVLMLSMHEDAYYVRKALEAGASGYVLKDRVSKVLVEAVETALNGRRYLSNNMREML